MAEKRYVVTGHMAAFDTFTSDGKRRMSFFRGQAVPEDATPDAIKHNLDVNLIAEVPGSGPVGVDTAGAAIAGDERAGEVDGKPGETFLQANTVSDEQAKRRGLSDDKRDGDADSDVAAKREAARSKLPSDGSVPDGRASQATWVEYHVAQGGNYSDLAKQDKAELVSLAQQRTGTAPAPAPASTPSTTTPATSASTAAKPTPAKPSK